MTLEILAAHMLGDFVLQNNWMAKNKFKRRLALIIHALVYSFCCLPVLLLYGTSTVMIGVGFGVLAVTHAVIDSRRWVSAKDWEFKPLMVDQTLHILVWTFISNFCLKGLS